MVVFVVGVRVTIVKGQLMSEPMMGVQRTKHEASSSDFLGNPYWTPNHSYATNAELK